MRTAQAKFVTVYRLILKQIHIIFTAKLIMLPVSVSIEEM